MSDYEVISIRVPRSLLDRMQELSSPEDVAEVHDQLELMANDICKRFVSHHMEKKVVEDNLDLFNG